MIHLTYRVASAGWATVFIDNGIDQDCFSVSYLHDSLKELARSALQIREKAQQTVVFMDEPGEAQLRLRRGPGNTLIYEVRWYDDFASWGLMHEDDHEVLMRGETTVPSYINQVRNLLIEIYDTLGPDRYQAKWIQHRFPMEEFEVLRG